MHQFLKHDTLIIVTLHMTALSAYFLGASRMEITVRENGSGIKVVPNGQMSNAI